MLSRDDSTEHAGEASERSGTGPLDYPRRHGLPWHFENVPDEMKAECRWVLVRLALQDDGKITKEPYMAAQPDRKASSAAPSTWASFAEAVEAWGRGNWQGLMFALGDGWAGVDFDRVRDQETKDVAAWAEEEAKRLDSYTEVSVSGTGLHTVVYGTLPTSEGCKNADLEMYDHGRFFAVTGRRMPWSPLVVNASQDVLADLCRRRFPEKVEAAEQQQRASVRYLPLPVDDDDLLRLARAAKNGDKFSALYDGGRHGYASESEATAALVRMLAFWTRNDAARMDRLFRRSALMREKWDEKRAGTTWGMREIERACALTTDVYEPGLRDEPFELLDDLALDAATEQPGAGGGTAEQRRGEAAGQDGAYFRLLTDVEAEALKPVPGLLGDVLFADTVAMLYGPTGAWKSFVAIAWGLSVATGTPWLGRDVPAAGDVVYVCAEGARGAGKRIAAWKRQYGWHGSTRFFVLPHAVALMQPDQVKKLAQSIVHAGVTPKVMIIDTLARAMVGGDENSQKDAATMVAAADQLRRAFRSCVLLVHHTGWDTSHPRGSTSFPAAVDTTVRLDIPGPAGRRPEPGEVVYLVCEKQKDADPFPRIPFTTERVRLGDADDVLAERSLAVVESDGTGEHAGHGDKPSPKAFPASAVKAWEQLSSLCMAHPPEAGVPYSQWRDAVMVLDYGDKTFKNARAALMHAGWVVKMADDGGYRVRTPGSAGSGSEQTAEQED